MTEISMETCLLDMPYEVLFKIFCTLPKDKLIKISRLCSKFRQVAGDTRLWKNVSIKCRTGGTAFQDLYLEPWPVKAINLSEAMIKPPVSLQTEQMIKVAKLDLLKVIANKVTITAILAKYQCTELNLDCDILRIGPEGFSKQTALEVLTVSAIKSKIFHSEKSFYRDYYIIPSKEMHQLLAPILRYFKNLKTLDVRHGMVYANYDMSSFVKNLPTSLEKLILGSEMPDDAFFKLLAERTPNLRELGVLAHLSKKYKSLLEFQFLETLHFETLHHSSDMYKFLIKFPALKTVNIMTIRPRIPEDFRKMLQPHGIILGFTKYHEQNSDAINSWTYL